MSAVCETSLPFSVPAGAKLWGEIITWSCSGITIKHLDLVETLRASDLDESVARELAPRHAFARACRKLSEARIIRQVAEDEKSIHFQFTAEHREGNQFFYDLETMLALDKASGKVTCSIMSLAAMAQTELDRCLAARTGSDVTRIIQKLFERRADLFPIREQGGAYFVPREHTAFVGKIQAFLLRLNGRIQRFPVPTGTAEGDRSVKESVAAGLSALIAEHQQAVATFGSDTRESTLERAAERIRQTKFKIEAYSAYLAEEKGRLESQLSDAARKLRAKVAELAATEEPETAAPSLLIA
jgi:hypothetical protein